MWKHAGIGPESFGIVVCRSVCTVLGIVSFAAQIRPELENLRPDPYKFSGPFQLSRTMGFRVTCNHSVVFILSFWGLDQEMAATLRSNWFPVLISGALRTIYRAWPVWAGLGVKLGRKMTEQVIFNL